MLTSRGEASIKVDCFHFLHNPSAETLPNGGSQAKLRRDIDRGSFSPPKVCWKEPVFLAVSPTSGNEILAQVSREARREPSVRVTLVTTSIKEPNRIHSSLRKSQGYWVPERSHELLVYYSRNEGLCKTSSHEIGFRQDRMSGYFILP